jgi:hypothetical protein
LQQRLIFSFKHGCRPATPYSNPYFPPGKKYACAVGKALVKIRCSTPALGGAINLITEKD